MRKSEKGALIPKGLLITGCAFGILLWVALLFYAFLLGGSPGPGYERMVPYAYGGVMALGLAGAVTGLAGIRKAPGGEAVLFFSARREVYRCFC